MKPRPFIPRLVITAVNCVSLTVCRTKSKLAKLAKWRTTTNLSTNFLGKCASRSSLRLWASGTISKFDASLKENRYPLPPWARGSVRMRSETVQLILERYEAVILNEDDGLALNRFLQRENAYNHIQSLSFPVIFSLRDAQLTMACSELHELHLHLTCTQSCRTMHELIRHLSLDRILEHKKILNIYLHIQCPCLWSDNVPAPGSGQWHGEELAQWLSDEFELRRPGDVKIHMSTWRGRITTIIV